MDKLLFTVTDDELADVFDFDVIFEVYGNQNNTGMWIDTGNGDAISTSPGWKLRVLADEDGDGTYEEVLTANINGVAKFEFHDDGSQTVTSNGHGLIYDPEPGGDPGVKWYKLSTGHFTWTGDANGDTLIPLSGNGQLVDLWDYFA